MRYSKVLAVSFLIILCTVSVGAIDFDVSTEKTHELRWGETETGHLEITSLNGNLGMTCTLDNRLGDEEGTVEISPGLTEQLEYQVSAPTMPHTGTETYQWSLFCDDGLLSATQEITVTVSFPTEEQLEQYQQTVVEPDIMAEVEEQIQTAEEKIAAAEEMGGDVSPLRTRLDDVRDTYTTAQTDLDEALDYFQQEQFSLAESKSGEAQSTAENAESSLDNLVSDAEQIISERESLRSEVESTISTAEQKDVTDDISTAEQTIQEAEEVGADVNGVKQELQEARDLMEDADSALSDADDLLDDADYEQGQTVAEEAIGLYEDAAVKAEEARTEAEELITQMQEAEQRARSTLWTAGNRTGELQERIEKIQGEIAEGREKALDVTTAEERLDSARNQMEEFQSLISEGQDALEQGNFNEALTEAQEAANKADEIDDILTEAEDSISGAQYETGATVQSEVTKNEALSVFESNSEVQSQRTTLQANGYERTDRSYTARREGEYKVTEHYQHPSGETATVSGTVDAREDTVSASGMNANPQQVQQEYQQAQESEQQQQQFMMIGGVLAVILIAGAFTYKFVNPVNKKINKFVSGDGEEISGGTEFDCPSCGAPVTPDGLEDGECPYCGSTVSP